MYVIAIVNRILNDIEISDIIHIHTLLGNITDIQEKTRYNVILANPPLDGKEHKEIQ